MARRTWNVTPAALGGPLGTKQDWQRIVAHRSPEIRALFTQLMEHDRVARLEEGPRVSAKRHAARLLVERAKGVR